MRKKLVVLILLSILIASSFHSIALADDSHAFRETIQYAPEEFENDSVRDSLPPEDVTRQCVFKASSNGISFQNAIDDNLKTFWSSKSGKQSIKISVNSFVSDLRGIYVQWYASPAPWVLYAVSGTQKIKILENLHPKYFAEWIEIPKEYAGHKDFILANRNRKKFSIAEMSLYHHGIPDFVPLWDKFDGQVDLMTVAAHPDDECIFMGAFYPLAREAGKDSVTVFMTYSTNERRNEAQEAVWLLGDRYYPVLRQAKDKKTLSLKPAMRISGWSEKKLLPFLVEQIRKYKPAVIATHDIYGEYGHGAHQITSLMVIKAFDLSNNKSYHKSSVRKYGVWEPKKLYIHLYGENTIELNIEKALKYYDGRTVLEVIKEAFLRHQSQQASWRYFIPSYDVAKFGLYKTNVGLDSGMNDPFENID